MNEPAFPYRYQEVAEPPHYYHGLTKRELFAAMAMQSLIHHDTTLDEMDAAAIFARRAADALLAALDQQEHPHD